jgi:hypothetical protein
MAEDSGQSVMSSLESHIVPLVPGLAERLHRGIRVLDLGCGRRRPVRWSSITRRACAMRMKNSSSPISRSAAYPV